ncbi:Gfo/Idh/MocA family protein [Pontibacter sp. MBLB2868]|uniref:Gfo/Idh/MocA family protein n=1 Tax=Pontibacter sp. MBLB2868 TaxID=3451555 RepID=UPI003F74C541
MKMQKYHIDQNRRKFLKGFSFALGATAFGMPLLSLASDQAGITRNKSKRYDSTSSGVKKLGVALVGLGRYSTNQLAPALQETEKCYLSGIVTGTPSKAGLWQKKYGISEKNMYNYQTMDQIRDNPDIDIIYIVLPNGMHAEYTIKAAETGKHVICEKPMATSVKDCQQMIDACNRNHVKLSIGYRLHFEPHHQRVMELGQQELYGPVKKIEAADSFVFQRDPSSWRLDKELAGGGPLMDLGIYCVQGAIYTLGQEPIAVTANFDEVTRPDYFDEVEQSIKWQMEFPDGAVADCSSSYNDSASRLYGKAERGWWELQPSFGYGGIRGRTSDGPMNLPNVNQQARQMDAFATCILEDKQSRVPGEMGLRDVRILMAIYEAARTGNKVKIG